MQVVFVPVSHEPCEEEVFAESLTMLSTLTSEILGIFLDVLDHHSVGSRTSFTSFVNNRAGCSSRETIPTVTTGSKCESLAMFSTILYAELVSGEPSDEDSAWIETGGDSLTFSESHLMGAQLGLRLAVTL